MTQIRQQSRGMCRNCGYVGAKASMTKHQAQCPERGLSAGSSSSHASIQKTTHDAYRLRVSGQYRPDYWLDVEVPVGATLDDLDGFLRAVWLECCGHLSAFTVGPQDDYDNVDPFSAPRAGVQPPLSRLGLEVGQKFGYTYDFGSSTDLSLQVQALERLSGKASKSVRLLSRNLPPELPCSECSAPAKRVHGWDYDEATGGPLLYCAKHGKKTREEQLPVVNSPRMGVCGYEGGSLDDWPPAAGATLPEAAEPVQNKPKTSKPKISKPGKSKTSKPDLGPDELDAALKALALSLGALPNGPYHPNDPYHQNAALRDDAQPDDEIVSLEELRSEAATLPQRPKTAWAVVTQELPDILPEDQGLPVLITVFDLVTLRPLRLEVLPDPGPDEVLSTVLLEMLEPSAEDGQPSMTAGFRPEVVLTPDAALAFSLHAGLAGLGVRAEQAPLADLLATLETVKQQIIQGLQDELSSQQRPPYLSGASDEEVGELLSAFKRFLKAEPWKYLSTDKPLYAHWLGEDGQPRQLYATVMGELGQVYGLALYPDWISHAKHVLNSQQSFFSGPELLLEATGGVEMLQQTEAAELHPDDQARLRSVGLGVRATSAPELLRFGPDGPLAPITPLPAIIAVLNVVAGRLEHKPGRTVTSLRGDFGGVSVRYPAGPRDELGEQERSGSVRLSLRGTSASSAGAEVVIVGPPETLLRRAFSAARAELKARQDARSPQRKASVQPVMLPYRLDIRDAVLGDESETGPFGEPTRVQIWDSRVQAPDLTLAHLLRLGPLIDMLGTSLFANPLPEPVEAVSVATPELD